MLINIQTDYDIGFNTGHEGKGSDYDDLSDEYFLQIVAKQYLKFNFRFFDSFIWSYVW